MPDDEPSKNPFVRWKQHVDAHIGLTLNSIFGIPSMVSKNFVLRRPDAPGTPGDSAEASEAPAQDQPDVLEGLDAAQLLAWHKFVHYSPYSPLNLAGSLPPPMPRDVPYGTDPDGFTFADAFEDLLEASSGRPMTDLRTRARRNLMYRMVGEAEPDYILFDRLHRNRLLDAYFPRPLPSLPQKPALEGQRDVPAAEKTADGQQPIEEEWEQGQDGEEVAEDWKEQAAKAFRDGGKTAERPFENSRRGVANLFDFERLDRVMRSLGRIIEEETGFGAGQGRGGQGRQQQQQQQEGDKPADGPDAEDDLYNAIKSSYEEAEKSLSAFFRSIGDITFSGEASSSMSTSTASAPPKQLPESASSSSSSKLETVKTTEEHVDAFGNHHVKTVIRRLNADGDEVARETHYSIRSGSASRPQVAERVEEQQQQQQQQQQAGQLEEAKQEKTPEEAQSKKAGWFWK